MDFFEHNGVRLAYRVDGSVQAPPLILVNSLGTDLRMWQPLLPHLVQRFRVIRADTRGHGQSEPGKVSCTIEDLGHDLLALLDTLEIERASICGLSFGGMTALWLAIHYPWRLQRAVFANTAARIGSREIWDARMAAIRGGGMAAIREAVLARFLSMHYRQQYQESANMLGEILMASHPQGYIAACEVLRETDLRGQVQTITVPSLILGGELDEATPPAQAQELHEAIAGSQLHIFPQVAHISSWECPQAFGQCLLEFLEK